MYGLHARFRAEPGKGAELAELLLEAELEVTKALIDRGRPLIAQMSERTELSPLGGKGL